MEKDILVYISMTLKRELPCTNFYARLAVPVSFSLTASVGVHRPSETEQAHMEFSYGSCSYHDEVCCEGRTRER